MTGTVNINGRWPLELPDHRVDQWAEWEEGGWEVERINATWEFVAAHSRADTPVVVYDIGAETGDLPALWASWGCRVVLVEPSANMWPSIRECFEANDLARQVAGCFVGFAADYVNPSADDALILGPWPRATHGQYREGFSHLDERPDIPACTIDWLATQTEEPPDIITIDVEGSEYFVLEGAVRTMETHRPTVLVSVHPEFAQERHDIRTGFLEATMAAAGYIGTLIASDHEDHWLYLPEERT